MTLHDASASMGYGTSGNDLSKEYAVLLVAVSPVSTYAPLKARNGLMASSAALSSLKSLLVCGVHDQASYKPLSFAKPRHRGKFSSE